MCFVYIFIYSAILPQDMLWLMPPDMVSDPLTMSIIMIGAFNMWNLNFPLDGVAGMEGLQLNMGPSILHMTKV